MTTPRPRLAIATALTFILMSMLSAGRVPAASLQESGAKVAAPAPETPAARLQQDGQERPTPSAEDLESFRADLIRFVKAYKELAALAAPREAQRFNGIETQLQKLSLKQLSIIRSGMPDYTVVGKAATRMSNSVAKSKLLRGKTPGAFASVFETNSPGFPGADYPSCGSTRVDESTIDASDIALFAAEGVRDAASRACDEVVVIAGEGGNGSLACIATDAIYVAAKAVNFGLHFCNDKIDEAELGATYDRLTHLHSDLEASVANDNANKTAIINNDNANKTAIINNDNTNTANLTALINQVRTDIINNANANKEELKNLILRTQIEADLATADNAVPLALYETPSTTCTASLANPPTQCGYLDLVRTIVKETIANVAGPNAAKANALLAQGDAQKAAGRYKQAYLTYRQAYKTAAK
jgi:hypothetical protein